MNTEDNITDLSEQAKLDSCEHRNLLGGEFWRKVPAYANVSEEQFNDYKWQLKNSITSVKKLLQTR